MQKRCVVFYLPSLHGSDRHMVGKRSLSMQVCSGLHFFSSSISFLVYFRLHGPEISISETNDGYETEEILNELHDPSGVDQ